MPIMKKIGINKVFFYIYCVFSLIPIIVNALWIIILKEFRGEFQYSNIKVTLGNETVLFILTLFLLLFTILCIFYFLFNKKRITFSPNYTIDVNRKRLELYITLMILINFILYIKTGIGKAGGAYVQKSYTFLIYFWNYDFFFWVYYYRYALSRNKKYYFIVFLFCLFQLVQGWTAFVFNVFLCELFIRSRDKKNHLKLLLMVPLFFIGGGLLYTILFPLKFWIRTGSMKWISVLDGFLRLSERLSFFSYSAVAVQNSNEIIDLYNQYNTEFAEAMSFFSPWVPSFILKVKSLRLMNNLVMLSAYPNFGTNTSAGVGPSYFYLLYKLGIEHLLLFLILCFVWTFIYKILIDNLAVNDEENYNCSSYMFFLAILNMFSGYTFRRYGTFIPAIWTFILLIFMGVFKIKRRRTI